MLQPGHGEFPHIVVAPGDVDEVVEDAFESFNWADRYQLPVIVLCDKLLSTTYVTHDGLKLDALPPIDRGAYFDVSKTAAMARRMTRSSATYATRSPRTALRRDPFRG